MAIATGTELHTLHRATGSAHHVSTKLSQEVLCAVNAPVEVQRRDELPNEAYIDVHVRPQHGVGMVRERHLESLIQALLKDVILVRLWPRTAIQVTLQILNDDTVDPEKHKTGNYLTILASMLNAVCLALIDAGVPMRCTFVSTTVLSDEAGKITSDPDFKSIHSAKCLHVFAFSSKGELLLVESEGKFSMGQWEAVEDAARQIAIGQDSDGDMMVDGEEKEDNGIVEDLRTIVQRKVKSDNRWRDG